MFATARVGTALIVGARTCARRYVLIHLHDETQASEVLVANADRAPASQLLFDLDARLTGIGVLKVPVHELQVEERNRRYGSGEDSREHWRRLLRGSQADARVAQVRNV
jgi:hypothetical protein